MRNTAIKLELYLCTFYCGNKCVVALFTKRSVGEGHRPNETERQALWMLWYVLRMNGEWEYSIPYLIYEMGLYLWKLHRVFLSHNTGNVSSHSLLFHQHVYRRQLSNRSMLHAGRYLYDKEICYLWTVIVTANVCQSLWKLINTGHISAIMYDVLTKPCVFAIQSLDRHHWYP